MNLEIATAQMVTALSLISDQSSQPELKKLAYNALKEYSKAKKEYDNAIVIKKTPDRYRIKGDYQQVLKTCNTVGEIIQALNSKEFDVSINSYQIEDVLDDIEIDADTLLQAWKEGERPEDLQMF